jgi:TRAP transporter TAXI family solute receptor
MGAVAAGCDVREFARAHGAKQRLSLAAGPIGGTYYIYGGGVARLISQHVPNVEATAEVTAASVDNLKFLHGARTDLALTLASTAQSAFDGSGVFAGIGRVPVRCLAMLFTQPLHFVTLVEKGITRLADLRGKSVSSGSPGSGTEEIVLRLLDAVGLNPATDLRRERLGPANAAEALRDGKIDAFFWSSGVPTSAVLDLATTFGKRLRLVPTTDVLAIMQQKYGPLLFFETPIPAGSYPGLDSDVPTVGVATLLVVDESMGEGIVHDITTALFEHRAELAAIHPEAAKLRPETASTGSPIPFHPGAIAYYREVGVWRE